MAGWAAGRVGRGTELGQQRQIVRKSPWRSFPPHSPPHPPPQTPLLSAQEIRGVSMGFCPAASYRKRVKISAKLRVRSWLLSFSAAENLGVFVDAVGFVLFYYWFFFFGRKVREKGGKKRKKKEKGKMKKEMIKRK